MASLRLRVTTACHVLRGRPVAFRLHWALNGTVRGIATTREASRPAPWSGKWFLVSDCVFDTDSPDVPSGSSLADHGNKLHQSVITRWLSTTPWLDGVPDETEMSDGR